MEARSTATIEAAADRIHSAAIHLLRYARREDVASGLGPARLSALSVVVFAGPLTLGELAAAEGVRPPTMSRLVDALGDAGLVHRREHGSDRCIVRIVATAKGTRLLQRARGRRIAALVDVLRDLDGREVRVVAEAAELIERALAAERRGNAAPAAAAGARSTNARAASRRSRS